MCMLQLVIWMCNVIQFFETKSKDVCTTYLKYTFALPKRLCNKIHYECKSFFSHNALHFLLTQLFRYVIIIPISFVFRSLFRSSEADMIYFIYFSCYVIDSAEIRNPGRDLRVLFFNSFRQLNMLFERLNILFAQLIILFEKHNYLVRIT